MLQEYGFRVGPKNGFNLKIKGSVFKDFTMNTEPFYFLFLLYQQGNW